MATPLDNDNVTPSGTGPNCRPDALILTSPAAMGELQSDDVTEDDDNNVVSIEASSKDELSLKFNNK